MPPVRCVPTATAKRALEAKGYRVIDEDDLNWAFAMTETDVPILLPKAVPFVPMDIMQHYANVLSIPETPDELEAATMADTDD